MLHNGFSGLKNSAVTENSLFYIAILITVGSSNPIGIKYALNSGWSPLILGITRMGIIGLLITLWIFIKKEQLISRNRKAFFFTIISAVCKGAGVTAYYIALTIIPANRSVILSTFSPIISLILIHYILEHDRIQRHHIVGIAISLTGILGLLMVKNTGASTDPGSQALFSGDMLMIASIISHNAMVVFEKKAFINGAKPRQLIITNMSLSVLVCTVLLLFFVDENPGDIPVNTRTLLSLAYLVTIAGVFLFNYRRWLVSRLEVSYINSFSHVGKAVSIFYALILLGESISAFSIVCFIVIIMGTVIATRNSIVPMQYS